MKIMIVAGGTKGHISPALVFAKLLKEKDKELQIYFVCTIKDTKYELEKEAYLDHVIYLEAYGITKSVKKWYKNYCCYQKIKVLIKNNNINKIIGFGGYISGISLLAGKKCKIKTFLHEQNSIMGKANRYTLKFANKIFLSYPIKNLQIENAIVVGNPVYISAKHKKEHLYQEKNTILFTSGSLGAKIINDFVVEFLKSNHAKKYKITIICGNKYYDEMSELLELYENVILYPYTDQLVELMASSMIVVTRAGASTLFEIMGVQSVPIIIPSINVTENHQYFNAKYFTDQKMGELLEEKDLSLENFLEKLKLIENNYYEYLKNIKTSNLINSTNDMIKEVLDVSSK